MHNKNKRTCIICGDEIVNPNNQMDVICKNKEHYYKCPSCGKLIRITNYKSMGVRRLFKTSKDFKCKILKNNKKECVIEIPGKLCDDCWKEYKKTKEYKKERWEKDNETFKCNHNGHSRKEFAQTDIGKKNINKAVDAAQTPKAKEKQRQTMVERYGVDNYSKTDDFLIKSRETSQRNWGVDNPAQSKEIQKRQKETLMKNYGVEYNYFIPGHAEKMIKAANTPEAKAKQRKTMKEKYGVSNTYFIPGHAEKMIEAASKADNTKHKSKTNTALAKELEKYGLIVKQEYQIDKNKFIDFKCSNPENDQSVLVEYNPTITHNFDINYQNLAMKKQLTKPNRPKEYHRDRSRLVEEQGKELIQWFEHHDKEKMIDFILSKCGMNSVIIGARQCSIKQIDGRCAKDFFDTNHVLGLGIKPKINYGLFYKEELLAVMSFNNIKNNKTNQALCGSQSLRSSYELIRFCNKSKYSVTGGAQRLFNHFVREYSPVNILTYSDYNLGNGTIYKMLGFTLVNKPKPSCFWTKIRPSGIYINNNLVLRGVDRFLPRYVNDYFFVGTDEEDFIKRGGLEVYGKWPTNTEIMLHYGFVRVYDSGYKTWLWQSKDSK